MCTNDANQRYPEAYRDFDKLIWQVPSWATGVFFGVMVVLARFIAIENWSWCVSKNMMLACVSFSGLVFQAASCYALLRFRCHQAYIPMDRSEPFAKHISGQLGLQFSVMVECAVLLSLFAQACGAMFWAFLIVTVPVSFLVTIGIEWYMMVLKKGTVVKGPVVKGEQPSRL